MKLSVSLMMHRSREQYLPYLKEQLGDVPVAMDEYTGHKDHVGIWENCKRAWLMHDPTADYHVVIQDDALITSDFYRKAEKVLESDFHCYLFYIGYPHNRPTLKRQLDRAKSVGLPHIFRGKISNEVAICMKTSHIQPMIDYCDKMGADLDRYIQYYFRRNGMMICYPLLSLVNHRNGYSLHREVDCIGREAYWFEK